MGRKVLLMTSWTIWTLSPETPYTLFQAWGLLLSTMTAGILSGLFWSAIGSSIHQERR